MDRRKGLKWLPVISSFCFLFLLFAFGSLAGPLVGPGLVGAVIFIVGAFSSAFSDHYNHLRDLWLYKMVDGTHYAIISISILTGLFFIYLFFQNYRINFLIEKKIPAP